MPAVGHCCAVEDVGGDFVESGRIGVQSQVRRHPLGVSWGMPSDNATPAGRNAGQRGRRETKKKGGAPSETRALQERETRVAY